MSAKVLSAGLGLKPRSAKKCMVQYSFVSTTPVVTTLEGAFSWILRLDEMGFRCSGLVMCFPDVYNVACFLVMLSERN